MGQFKLNTDGSTKGNTSRVGRANVICNEEGNWVKGLFETIGHASSVMAEAQKLRWLEMTLLLLAREPQIQNIIVELDAMEFVLALNNNKSCPNILIHSIVNDCKSLAQVFNRSEMIHCYRETNKSMLMPQSIHTSSCKLIIYFIWKKLFFLFYTSIFTKHPHQFIYYIIYFI